MFCGCPGKGEINPTLDIGLGIKINGDPHEARGYNETFWGQHGKHPSCSGMIEPSEEQVVLAFIVVRRWGVHGFPGACRTPLPLHTPKASPQDVLASCAHTLLAVCLRRSINRDESRCGEQLLPSFPQSALAPDGRGQRGVALCPGSAPTGTAECTL